MSSRVQRWFGLWSQSLVTAFPLLSRELIEQSARRRTFVLRTVYAVAVYGLTVWAFWTELTSWSGQSFSLLGRGREFFESLAMVQFLGLYLFLPAMTSGVLTAEKERDTLSLLLLTRMGPWSILIGKLLARLVPMGTFCLMSLPLFAVAYSLGGVNETEILALSWVLMATALQVGSLALACSTWFRTTASAFMATYLVGAALIFGPPLLLRQGDIDPLGIVEFLREYCSLMGLAGGRSLQKSEVTFLLFGPWACLHPSALNQPWNVIVARTVPMLMCAGVCLAFARTVLWRRAFLQPSSILLTAFHRLDALFQTLNQNRWTRGIVLTRENVELPEFDPIRWRETKKRSLGTTRYLVRLLLVLEVPVLFGVLFPDYGSLDVARTPMVVTEYLLWVAAVLVIAVQAAGLIGSERSRQTLDVLLTTPLSSETIVCEKLAGVWRTIKVLWVPFATVYLFQLWWSLSVNFRGNELVAFETVRGILAVALYPPLVAWLGFHMGMRTRSQARATLATIGLVAGACLIPWAVAEAVHLPIIRWLSPAAVLSTTGRYGESYGGYYSYAPVNAAVWAGLIIHFLMAGLMLIGLRARGLISFAVFVQRNDGQLVDDDDIDRLSRLREQIVGRGIFRARSDEEGEE